MQKKKKILHLETSIHFPKHDTNIIAFWNVKLISDLLSISMWKDLLILSAYGTIQSLKQWSSALSRYVATSNPRILT